MRSTNRDITYVDHLLASLGAALAVFAALQSVGKYDFSWIMAAFAIVGGMVGYTINVALRRTKLIDFGSYLYGAIAVTCMLLAMPLNSLIPDGGFPFQILIAGTLTWVVIFGSVACWKDATLCFQAVPCIAIFGLVGAFDTYKPSPILFFIFIVLVASLFFRAHARTMVNQATRAMAPSGDPAEGDKLVKRVFDSGAWRWMAGPEWAIVSALIIVGLSLFGAPMVQNSVKPLSDAVRITLPSAINAASSVIPNAGRFSTTVGNGPQSKNGFEVFKVKAKTTGYLRGRVFDTFTGRGWRSELQNTLNGDRNDLQGTGPLAWQMTPQGTDEQVTIRGVSGFHESLYTPGDGVSVELEPTYYRIRYDGTIGIRELKPREEMKFTCRVLDQVPDTAEPGLPPYFADFQQLYIERGPLTSRERDFVKQATLNSITPMARAQALEKAIGKQCKYNLEASKIADDEKLTDTFMFKNREGYCDLYATTMAEYARELGFATRVVSGYLVQEERTDSEGFISVSDDDAHMWAEIYFADVGWVPFDPTKYAEDITKSHGTGISWSKAGIALAVVALVSMIIFIVVHWIRDAKKGTSVFKEKNPAERVYASFQKVIASHAKVPRRLSETPVEYLTRVESTLGNHASVATEINQRLESEMFSRASNNEALAVIQSDVKQLKKLLRQR